MISLDQLISQLLKQSYADNILPDLIILDGKSFLLRFGNIDDEFAIKAIQVIKIMYSTVPLFVLSGCSIIIGEAKRRFNVNGLTKLASKEYVLAEILDLLNLPQIQES